MHLPDRHAAAHQPGLPSLSRLFTLSALALGLAMPTLAQTRPGEPARVAHREKGAFPQITLPEHGSRGQRAIDHLGGRLPEVAAWYGKSADEFRSQLLNDATWRLDKGGRVFIVEELLAPLPAFAARQPGVTNSGKPAAVAGATGASPGLLDGTLLPLDQTFLLHSRPGAKRTIYLNFRGATLTQHRLEAQAPSTRCRSTWTASPTPSAPPSCSASSTSGSAWPRTSRRSTSTSPPSPAPSASPAASSTDDVYGTTVLITSARRLQLQLRRRGLPGRLRRHVTDFYKPALVFYDKLGSGNEKNVAEAISHEAGHNMGLSHDGTASVGYYQGHGSGATGWAPIMGVGYYQALVQWSKGEYSGANNTCRTTMR
jgi:hypothetical protein